MSIQRQIRVPVAVLLTIQIVTGLGTMGVLTRMTPQIERILQENDRTVRAAEDMLATLATEGLDAEAAAQFNEALARAQANVTERAEPPLLAQIEALRDDAWAGDVQARTDLARAIVELAQVNHASMQAADDRAQRLGEAGTWAVVLLTLAAAASSIAVLRRLHERLVLPLWELQQAANAPASGDAFRRARIERLTPELVDIAAALNRRADAALARGGRPAPKGRPAASDVDWNGLVDAWPQPAWLLDGDGTVLAANEMALAWTATAEGVAWRDARRRQWASGAGIPGPTDTDDASTEARWVAAGAGSVLLLSAVTPPGQGSTGSGGVHSGSGASARRTLDSD